MTRVLSGAVLLLIALGAVWFAPPLLFLAIAVLLAVLAFVEYARLADASGLDIPRVASGTATALTCATFARLAVGVPIAGEPPLDVVLITVTVTLGAITMARWHGGDNAVARAAAAVFPCLYVGLPVGAMVAVREAHGVRVLLLLMLTVAVSDTAQYYTGRLVGRTPLAPAISPKKTIEGAVGGFVFGALVLIVGGAQWLPDVDVRLRAVLGVVIVALGVVGDLFESMLKRSAGVKDSSSLIPGHGGVLDRIDALLFAAPVYYVVLKYV